MKAWELVILSRRPSALASCTARSISRSQGSRNVSAKPIGLMWTYARSKRPFSSVQYCKSHQQQILKVPQHFIDAGQFPRTFAESLPVVISKQNPLPTQYRSNILKAVRQISTRQKLAYPPFVNPSSHLSSIPTQADKQPWPTSRRGMTRLSIWMRKRSAAIIHPLDLLVLRLPLEEQRRLQQSRTTLSFRSSVIALPRS